MLQSHQETGFSIPRTNAANLVAKRAVCEIQHELAGNRLEPGPAAVDDHIAAIGKNAQFRQGLFDFGELLLKSGEGTSQAWGGYTLGNQLLDGAKTDEIAEIVEFLEAVCLWCNQTQLFPIIQLLSGDVNNALNFTTRESVGCAHLHSACRSLAPLLCLRCCRYNAKRWLLGWRSRLFRQAFLERGHQIDYRGELWMRSLGNFLALLFCGDQCQHSLTILVSILLRLEWRRKALD